MSVLTSTAPIEFTVSAENSNYIDLANSFLYVRASVTGSDGSDLAKDVEIAPECNFLHTLWSQIDVYLNGLLVMQSNNNYPYRAYIENLLSFGQEAKTSQLSALLWYRNTSRHFDSCTAANIGYTQRKVLAAESKEIDMMGKLHIDLAFQNRYLLNGVEVLAFDSIQGSFLLAWKRRPGTKQSVFERGDLVCTQSKTQPGRTTCSRQSLAARHCKIPAATRGSQELYRAD